MGDFFGLTIGVSSLFAQRQALEIAGNNIANANTDGYSRQRVNLVQSGGQVTPAIYARSTSTANGVMATTPQRMRDMFLEARSALEHGTETSLTTSKTLLGRVEGIFNEPSDTGLQAQISDFWAGWEDLANNPGDLASRSQLLQRATTLVNSFNQADADLSNLSTSSIEQLKTVATGMNTAADRLAELNGSILRATADGLSPNSLMDQRDLLVSQLGEAAGVTTTTHGDGTMDVFLGGTALVRGDTSSHVQVSIAPGTNVTNANQPGFGVGLTWVKDGYPATVTSGTAGGLLDGVNRLLPSYRQGIDGVAAQLSSVVNAQHNQGIDLNGNQPGTVTGANQAGITIAAGVNDQFKIDPGPPGAPTAITLSAGVYAANATDAATLKADLNAKIAAAFAPGAAPAQADVRVVNGQLQVAITSMTPGGSITAGTGAANDALASLGIANGATAATDSLFTFVPATGVMQVVITDPRMLAAATPGGGVLGGGNALSTSNLGTVTGGPDDTYRNFIIGLGVETQAANRRVDIQHSIVTQLDAQRDSSAGVSLDEEMANLMMYQRGYEAASRLITTVDGLLDTLIHGTGLVGR
ncbi:MAG: flagellar hook-associated protein FlgK [Acidobacteria bacterium]|nr:flagellar hook-associated protein FlgK [Acidobacteriota bacterium]